MSSRTFEGLKLCATVQVCVSNCLSRVDVGCLISELELLLISAVESGNQNDQWVQELFHKNVLAYHRLAIEMNFDAETDGEPQNESKKNSIIPDEQATTVENKRDNVNLFIEQALNLQDDKYFKNVLEHQNVYINKNECKGLWNSRLANVYMFSRFMYNINEQDHCNACNKFFTWLNGSFNNQICIVLSSLNKHAELGDFLSISFEQFACNYVNIDVLLVNFKNIYIGKIIENYCKMYNNVKINEIADIIFNWLTQANLWSMLYRPIDIVICKILGNFILVCKRIFI